MQATAKEQQLHSTDILYVIGGKEYTVSVEIIWEGFLEEVGGWECFKEGGGRQLGKFEIKEEVLHRQNQAD